MRKFTVVIFNQLNIKNNKIDKDNFEKYYNKKIHVRNTLAINGVLKKKTTKLNFQPAYYEKYKYDKDNFENKSIKKHVGKHCIKKKSCAEIL